MYRQNHYSEKKTEVTNIIVYQFYCTSNCKNCDNEYGKQLGVAEPQHNGIKTLVYTHQISVEKSSVLIFGCKSEGI